MGVVTEEQRRAGLRRMKAVAGALLVLAAVTYLATLGRDGGWEWVNAASEAAMVGALADWFAVTALFRHPLGLPVPHTAIIPTRKDALGRSLQEFVAEHFLAADVVRDKVARADLARRAGSWLADPAHAALVTDRAAVAVAAGLRAVREEDLDAILDQAVVQKALAQEWARPAGRVLARVVTEDAHRRVVDLGISRLRQWLDDHQDVVAAAVVERVPSWLPSWVDDRLGRRLAAEAVRLVADVEADPDHRLRKSLDGLLLRFADDLQRDEATMARAEDVAKRLLGQADVRASLGRLWGTGRQLLIDAVLDADGELRRRATAAVADAGSRLAVDAGLQARVDRHLVDAAGFAVTTYGPELASVISDTVQRWDADDASRRIELHVGRDLQFIRINGTVVGALAGLAIHAVATAVR